MMPNSSNRRQKYPNNRSICGLQKDFSPSPSSHVLSSNSSMNEALQLHANMDLAPLQSALGYQFTNLTLLETALRHRSWVKEVNNTITSNERLEFLGDAVLEWAITDILYNNYPELDEGKLSGLRKRVVNADALTSVANAIGLGDNVLLNRGELNTGGRKKVSILCDTMEAVLGAIYLDNGRDAAYDVVRKFFSEMIEDGLKVDSQNIESKNQLQDLVVKCVSNEDSSIVYEHSETGPSHTPLFSCRVLVGGEFIAQATGTTKKTAEKLTANKAYGILNEKIQTAFIEHFGIDGEKAQRVAPVLTHVMEQNTTGIWEMSDAGTNCAVVGDTKLTPFTVEEEDNKIISSSTTPASLMVGSLSLKIPKNWQADEQQSSVTEEFAASHSDFFDLHSSSPKYTLEMNNARTRLNCAGVKSTGDLKTLQSRIGYHFQDRALLVTALRHRSWVKEVNNTVASNEKLEFLGDSVLAWVVTDLLYHQYPDFPHKV